MRTRHERPGSRGHECVTGCSCRRCEAHGQVWLAQTRRQVSQCLDDLCSCDRVIGIFEECERLEQVLAGLRVLAVGDRDLAEDVQRAHPLKRGTLQVQALR